MPLPTDDKVVETAHGLVNQLQTLFGKHPGFRPAHARGVLVSGTFTPTAEAAALSKAYHLNNTVPITARFSSSTGIPQIPDTDPNANPRGFAVRFHLPDHNGRRQHTDIVAHSTPHFPVRTGAEFLEMLQAVGASGAPDAGSPSPIEKFLGAHPTALTFVQAPKPSPTSFGKEPYFGLNAFKFIAADGTETFVRYRWAPVAGEEFVSDEELKTKSDSYLFDGVPATLASGPILFKLLAQIAEEGDPTNDITQQWPETRKIVELGEVKLEKTVENDAAEQKKIIFDPIPRTEGIDVSDDPILDMRAGVYLISGKERRAA